MFDLFLGDFNINVLANANNLRNILSEYQLLNRDSPHISGTILDYITMEVVQKYFLGTIQIVSIYFWDHEAAEFKLKLLWEALLFKWQQRDSNP